MSWVPFHEGLRKGDKRGIPRAVRFVYLELAQEARPYHGRLPLPRGFKDDVDAVHDVLGGSRREVADALRILTQSEAEETPMVTLEGPPGRRVLVISSFDRWVKPDSSVERTRKWRMSQSQSKPVVPDACDASPTVTSTVTVTSPTVTRGEERREEKRKEEVVTRKRATRLPEDWSPTPDYVAKIIRECGVDPRESLRSFRNHFLGTGGAKAVKIDWAKTFDNWVLEDHRRGKLSPVPAWKADEVLGQMTLGKPSPAPEPPEAPPLTAEERAANAKRLAEIFPGIEDQIASIGGAR